MLKIKDNVDLKELEKFGFEYEKKKYYIDTARDLMDSETRSAVFPVSKRFAIYININDRKITVTKNIVCWQDQSKVDVLFDLIQAGLVEKVSD